MDEKELKEMRENLEKQEQEHLSLAHQARGAIQFIDYQLQQLADKAKKEAEKRDAEGVKYEAPKTADLTAEPAPAGEPLVIGPKPELED